MESLILAQDERWRRALYMQVGRGPGACSGDPSGERVSNTGPTCPRVGDNLGKPGLIPHDVFLSHGIKIKEGLCLHALAQGGGRDVSACW